MQLHIGIKHKNLKVYKVVDMFVYIIYFLYLYNMKTTNKVEQQMIEAIERLVKRHNNRKPIVCDRSAERQAARDARREARDNNNN